jgi:ribosomal protein S26
MLFCAEHGETVVAAGPTLCETCATFAEIVRVRAADPSVNSSLASPDGR